MSSNICPGLDQTHISEWIKKKTMDVIACTSVTGRMMLMEEHDAETGACSVNSKAKLTTLESVVMFHCLDV